MYYTLPSWMKLVTRSGTTGKRDLEIPNDAQSAGVPRMRSQQENKLRITSKQLHRS